LRRKTYGTRFLGKIQSAITGPFKVMGPVQIHQKVSLGPREGTKKIWENFKGPIKNYGLAGFFSNGKKFSKCHDGSEKDFFVKT